MRANEALNPAQVKALMSRHRRMVARMLSEMNGDVRRMQVTAIPGWTAIMDSVRRDLAKLPGLPAEELRDALPAHDARVLRLMQMHADLMKGSKTSGRL